MFKNKSTEKEPICKNCGLFDPKSKLCGVIILHENKKIHLPVDANDRCFFLEEIKTEKETFIPEVQQLKMYTVDPKTGERTNKNGIVKIEGPEEFFNHF